MFLLVQISTAFLKGFNHQFPGLIKEAAGFRFFEFPLRHGSMHYCIPPRLLHRERRDRCCLFFFRPHQPQFIRYANTENRKKQQEAYVHK
jgi:hypothetical protein